MVKPSEGKLLYHITHLNICLLFLNMVYYLDAN